MATEKTSEPAAIAPDATEEALLRFLAEKVGTTVDPGQDLFASGLVSSMFAMELVVFLEGTFDVFIGGADLKLDHFRTVRSMTELVLRLREVSA